MSDGGKGSSPRPFSIPKEKFDDNWNRIFNKDNTGTTKNDYSDILSTEDCFPDIVEDDD